MARLARVASAIATAALSSACATAVPLPRVDPAEVLAVESEAYGSTLEELDRERNVRYWEIFLSDDEVVAAFPPEVRSGLAAGPVREHAGSLHEVFVERPPFHGRPPASSLTAVDLALTPGTCLNGRGRRTLQRLRTDGGSPQSQPPATRALNPSSPKIQEGAAN